MVHGDDFLGVGPAAGTKHVEHILTKAYKVKVQTMGDGDGEVQDIRVLNRILRRTPAGYRLEAHPRHAGRVLRELGLEGCKGARLPGPKAERNYGADGERSKKQRQEAGLDAVARSSLRPVTHPYTCIARAFIFCC